MRALNTRQLADRKDDRATSFYLRAPLQQRNHFQPRGREPSWLGRSVAGASTLLFESFPWRASATMSVNCGFYCFRDRYASLIC